MGGGNGAKAQQKRERNAKKASKAPTSQLKSNAEVKFVCRVCYTTMMITQKKDMETHLALDDAKHKQYKTVETMFERRLRG